MIKTACVDLEHVECRIGNIGTDPAVGLDLGEIAHAAQQPVGNSRRTARAPCNLARALLVHLDIENGRRTLHDMCQVLGRIELQPLDDAETVTQRRGQQTGTCRCADQRERGQVELQRTRCRPFANHDVDLVVLHRRIEHLLDNRAQAVDLVDKQHVMRLEVRQQRSEVTGLFKHGAGGLAQVGFHFIGNDVGKRCLAKARRAEDQHMIQRFRTLARSADEDLHLVTHGRLADVLAETARADGPVNGSILTALLRTDEAFDFTHVTSLPWIAVPPG